MAIAIVRTKAKFEADLAPRYLNTNQTQCVFDAATSGKVRGKNLSKIESLRQETPVARFKAAVQAIEDRRSDFREQLLALIIIIEFIPEEQTKVEFLMQTYEEEEATNPRKKATKKHMLLADFIILLDNK